MIKVEKLQCAYREKMILKGIDLEIKPGEMCAVMGGNGCGKTTLLRCLSRLIDPIGGNIQLDGRPLKDYTAKQLAQKESLVQQQLQTDLDFSAYELVMMGRNPYQKRLQNESDKDHKIVKESMMRTNTWHLRESRPNEMSGGELQRVMIARALAQQTPVMLLDEPTSNLDIAHQMEIMQMLVDINRNEKKTILIVVHDMNLAYSYCPDLLLLHEGMPYYHGTMKGGLTKERIQKVFGVTAEIIDDNIFFKK